MSILDDEQFEKYLMQFQPVSPEPLMVNARVRTGRGSLVYVVWAAAAAVVLIALIASVILLKPAQQAANVSPRSSGMEQFSNPPPLTIASANTMLESAPSFKAAVDNMVFQSESKPISEGRYSLLASLSKEEVKQ